MEGQTRVVDLDVAKISVGAGENKLPRRRWHSGLCIDELISVIAFGYHMDAWGGHRTHCGFPKRFRTGISVCFVRKRIWEVG